MRNGAVPGARAQRVMIEQVLRDAGAPPERMRRAATVILVREGAAGAEVLMVRRPETISFAGAWVFPGGRIDAEDGLGAVPDDDAARAAAVRETWEETGLVVAPATLIPIAVWDPPVDLPQRIRTWFFLAPAPEGVIRAQPGEVVESAWVRPSDMLERHATGQATLYPPTWVTLARLGTETAVRTVAEASATDPRHFVSQVHRTGDGLLFRWGDDDGTPDAVDRHRLDTTTLPWRYESGEVPLWRP